MTGHPKRPEIQAIVTALSGLALSASVTMHLAGAADAPTTPQARAAELVARGRAAIGPIESLKSLSATGTRKSRLGSSAGSPESYEVDFALPDRFVQLVKPLSRTPAIRTYVWGFNGSASLNGVRTSEISIGGQETDPTLEQQLFGRLLLGWLLVSPPYLHVEYTYAGDAEAPDGRKAFIVEVNGDKDFHVRLFLDATTCRPLMLSYRARRLALNMRSVSGQKPAGDISARAHTDEPSPQVDVVLYFSDVRQIGPFRVAHALIDSRDGRTAQEFQFTKVTINPDLKPALFARP